MGIFDPAGLAAELARLVNSPRVQKTIHPQPPAFGGAISQGPRLSYGSGSAFGGTVGSTIAQMGQQQQDPVAQLYQQLLQQLQQPVQVPQAVDSNAIMRQVQSAINPIYDAREKVAQGQSDRARKDVTGMYGALADDYERLAPEQVAQAQANKQEIESLYGTLRSNIEGNYSRVSKEQGELFQKLGIEDALPTVLDQQQAPVQDALIAASENQAQQEQRYQDIGQADATYYREGSPIATMAGNEISTDMLSQLQDYLQQVEGERSSGIQSAYLDQLGQANSLLAQQQGNAQSQTNQNQQMLWQMLQQQMQGSQQKQQPLTPDSFMQQLPPEIQQATAGAFTRLQRSPEAVYGKVQDPRNPVPGTYVDTSPQWYMSQADQMYQQGQIDPATYQALLQYMQLYFKQGQ